jgi:hypothetical protein
MTADANIGALMEALPDQVNGSELLQRIGRHCSTEFLLEVGQHCYHLVVERGRLVSVIPGPLRMRGWAFALRAEATAWQRFWEPEPAPGYSDLFAMSRYGHLRIEGDVGPLLAHLRYVKEVVALPRRMLLEAGS